MRVGPQLALVLLVDFKEDVGLVRERDLHLVLRGLKDLGRLAQGDLALVLSLVLVVFELAVLKELAIAYLLVKPPVFF